jgi:teichuronic acid biosynthesis glycosyltransferase TuaG
MSDLVSIITPTFNSKKFLKTTYESISRQSYKDWEWIVVDDCSSDNTVEILSQIALGDDRVKVYFNDVNSGAAVSRNKAISDARGRFIAFLDSDDVWHDTKLEIQLNFMLENNVAFSYMPYQVIDEEGNKIGFRGVPKRLTYSDLLKKPSIGCLTAMYDSQLLGKMYMPNTRKRQDLGLWLSILKNVDYAYASNHALAQYRVHSDSISSNKLSAAKFTWRLYRDVENMNLLRASYYFCYYAANSLLTYAMLKLNGK